MGLIVTLTGAAVATLGLFLLFGAWALVAAGLAVAVAGMLVDWDRVS